RGRIQLRCTAYPTDARSDHERIGRFPPNQNLLVSSIHRADTPSVGNRVRLDLEFDLKVALNTVHIQLNDSPAHARTSFMLFNPMCRQKMLLFPSEIQFLIDRIRRGETTAC